jgi:hypothetical protein
MTGTVNCMNNADLDIIILMTETTPKLKSIFSLSQPFFSFSTFVR